MSTNDPISIRIPSGLKERLQDAISKNGRSLNAEIRMRLEASFEAGYSGDPTIQGIATEVESIRVEMRGGQGVTNARIEELERRLALLEGEL